MNALSKKILSALMIISILCGFIPHTNALTPVTEDRFICKRGLSNMSDGSILTEAYERIAECIENREEYADLSDLNMTITTLDLVHNAVRNDPNGYFWLDTTYSYRYNTSSQLTTQYIPNYNSLAGDSLSDMSRNKKVFESAARAMIEDAGIDRTTSEYRAELLLHDAIVAKTVYEEGTNAHNEYGAIVEGKAVCQGYTLAFQYLLKLCGINACSVVGYAGEPHSWNLVMIDGDYYYTDVTWDDASSAQSTDRRDTYYAYFNVTEAVLRQDHSWEAPAYGLPECTSVKKNYFTQNPRHKHTQSSLTVDKVSALFYDGFARIYATDGNVTAIKDWFFNNAVSIAQKCGYDLTKPTSALYEYSQNEIHLFIDGVLSGPVSVFGDLNKDKILNSLDKNYLSRIIIGSLIPTEEQMLATDADSSGTINPIDANMITRLIMES